MARVREPAPGTSTGTFTIEQWPVENPTRCDAPLPGVAPGLPQKPLGEQSAAELCGRIIDKNRRKNCIQDVMVTGENGFAKAYAETETTVRNQFPQPPKLGYPADREQIPQSVAFTFSKTKDRESGSVTYRQCIWPIEKQFTLNDCDPRPIKLESKAGMLMRTAASTPAGVALKSGRSYFWKVIVEDGNGGMTESETRRLVIK